MRIRPIAALVVLSVPAVFASAVSGQAPSETGSVDGPTLSMSRAGLTAQATPGSMCIQPPGVCVDTAYPLTVHGRLPIRPRGRVVLEPSVEASELVAGLRRVRGSRVDPVGTRLTVRRLSARRWAVTLPKRLRNANVLDVFLRWDNPHDGRGDASFWGGIRRTCRRGGAARRA